MSIMAESPRQETPDPARPVAAAGEQVSQASDDGQPLITETVSQGSYRRPSLLLQESFRSVTACSPSPSPSPTVDAQADPLATDDRASRGGRRRMLRSGTSGSLSIPTANISSRSPSPSFFASPSPVASPNGVEEDHLAVASTSALRETVDAGSVPCGPRSPRISSDSGSVSSGKSHRRVSSTSAGLANFINRVIGKRTSGNAGDEEDTPKLAAASLPSSDNSIVVVDADDMSNKVGHSSRSMASSTRSGSHVAPRSELMVSSIQTHGLTPSTASTDLEEYLSARPASPSDHGSKHARGLARAKLLSRMSAASSVTADGELDDEACYVDGDCSDHLQHAERIDRIDFLTQLPSELALYIIYQLEDRADVLAAAQVSKSWRSLAMDRSVWRNLFFSHPGWAIREDAPLVLQRQAEMKKRRAKAASLRAKHQQQKADDQARSDRSTATHAYADRLSALKSWRETLHIPSFPDIANLSIGPRYGSEVDNDTSNSMLSTSKYTGVDVDGARSVAATASGSASITPMSPLRSPTAASGRFGLFLSPERGLPSTPAGKRRAQEAAVIQDLSTVGASRVSAISPAGSIYDGIAPPTSRNSIDESILEAEEDFAASLDWTQLYIDRYTLEQRWLRASSAAVSNSEAHPIQLGHTLFEPTKRFLRGHTDSVYCVRQDDGAGTGTGGRLVSGSRDRSIRVWDLDTGDCRHVLQGHTASVLSLKYDSTLLVSGSSDSEVYVWDFAAVLSSKQDADSEGKESVPTVHDTRKLLGRLRGHTSAVLDVTFDNTWIVTSSKDATVRVWKRSDLSFFCQFSHGGPVNAIDLQDGKVVSASGDGSMYLWDILTGAPIYTFQGHTKGLACILYRGDTVVSGSNDQTIRMWSTLDGKCTHVLQGHEQLVRTVSFDPVRGLVVSGGYDRVIKVWNTRNGDCSRQEPTTPTHASSPDQSDVTTSLITDTDTVEPGQEGTEEKVKLISHPVRELRCHRARIFDVDFNTTRIVSASEDHMICITFFGGQGIDTCLFA